MIRLPQRSVTRFFIPLIDVLTLLFCIFLLMPLVKATGKGSSETLAAREERIEQMERELERLRREKKEAPQQLRDDLERLRQEKSQTLQENLAVRVLEIDPATGKLIYYDPERTEIRTEADARALIERDRRVRGSHRREWYYLILYPRQHSSPYPHRAQREQYERWFQDVAHGWDIPGSPSAEGNPP